MVNKSETAPTSVLLLEFDPAIDDAKQGKALHTGLSVALQIGNSLWVANDETVCLERLTLTPAVGSGTYVFGRNHKRFRLDDYLKLPVPSTEDPPEFQEIDIEGLAYEGGYLWLTGSHSIKRKKPGSGKTTKQMRKQLTKLSAEANRYLLARVPVVERDGQHELVKETTVKGKSYTAAQLQAVGDENELMVALKNDEHLAAFLAIPGKENGFDIEGLAVSGSKIFLGLRGPVLRGWAVILEIALTESKETPSLLALKPVGTDGRLYKKHFLNLQGLGIRDLCMQGADLLILAGPTMDLDGPVAIYRWKNGIHSEEESVLDAPQLEQIASLPFGVGMDHAEGMCLYAPDGGKAHSLLVVHDAAAPSRQVGANGLTADVFTLI
ncbi:MAG: DUF3616 domain-containing protein [Pseudomonadota bacterium]